MKSANIATVKNQLSRLLGQVKNGETIVITDRNRPVARLMPLSSSEGAMAALHASGLVTPPESPLDLAAFLAAPRAASSPVGSLREAIVHEREDDR